MAIRVTLLVLAAMSAAGVRPAGAGPQVESRAALPLGVVLKALPSPVPAGGRYLFYLHGKIIEDEGVRPVSPRFGVYDYEEILHALAAPGVTVISEARAKGTVPRVFAAKVAQQVRALLAAGVAPDWITVVGFSKGGLIAMLVSSELQDERVRYVFMASCGPWIASAPGLHVSGQVLTIREASDELAGSCAAAFAQAGGLGAHRELELHLGGGHGAFFRPHAEWVEPVLAWAGAPE